MANALLSSIMPVFNRWRDNNDLSSQVEDLCRAVNRVRNKEIWFGNLQKHCSNDHGIIIASLHNLAEEDSNVGLKFLCLPEFSRPALCRRPLRQESVIFKNATAYAHSHSKPKEKSPASTTPADLKSVMQ